MKSTPGFGPVVVSLIVAALLSACSLLPEAAPVQTLDPRPSGGAPFAEAVDWTLDVARPVTDPVRDSNRVLVRTADGRLQNYASARWVAPSPELLRTLLLRHARDRNLAAEIQAGGGGGDRLLAIDLRRFELEQAGAALTAVIELDARLYLAPRYELSRSTLISERQALSGADAAAVNAAFEALLTRLLQQLGAWVREEPA
ncbi:MAG: ABC-type transport auxiliary lipoprotein family protein [Wenzhouxiangellaceae bacterium]|nr:ABC-type transport auxiliary lipoprotein family protein [Wenzhouxiangellaceae bacterium]